MMIITINQLFSFVNNINANNNIDNYIATIGYGKNTK